MKTKSIVKLTMIALTGLMISTQVKAAETINYTTGKKAVVITVNKPVMEFIQRTFIGLIKPEQIARVNEDLENVDQVTLFFEGTGADESVDKINILIDNYLEGWMFQEGYLVPESENDDDAIVPWMQNMHIG